MVNSSIVLGNVLLVTAYLYCQVFWAMFDTVYAIILEYNNVGANSAKSRHNKGTVS